MSWSLSELRVPLACLSLPFFYLLFCWPFKGDASFVCCYLCFMFILVMLSCLFFASLWSLPGKGLISWLSCVLCFLVFSSLSHIVFQVRYGTWSYRFLIFAFLSTFYVASICLKASGGIKLVWGSKYYCNIIRLRPSLKKEPYLRFFSIHLVENFQWYSRLG